VVKLDRCEACGAPLSTVRNELIRFAYRAAIILAGLAVLIALAASRETSITVVNGHDQSLTDGDAANNRKR